MTICVNADNLSEVIPCTDARAIPVASEPFVLVPHRVCQTIRAGTTMVMDPFNGCLYESLDITVDGIGMVSRTFEVGEMVELAQPLEMR
jgi:hypothetical protein